MVYPGQRTARAGRQKVYTSGNRTRSRISPGFNDLQTIPKGSFKSQNTQNSKCIGPCARVLQLNIEGISKDKCEYLSKLSKEYKIDLIALQETHLIYDQIDSRARIPGYKMIGMLGSEIYGSIMYIRQDISDYSVASCYRQSNIEIISVNLMGTTVSAVYKPPQDHWPDPPLPAISHPGVYVGDFNSHHTSWGYDKNDENGEKLLDWMDQTHLHLSYDAKDKKSFHSARWKKDTNPDLCLITMDANHIPLPHTRTLLSGFPRSQHRPVILTIGLQVPLIRTTQKPRWNFKKAQWIKYSHEVDSHLRWIPPKLENYKRFVGTIIGAAKRSIPRGYRRDYIPCWNEETEKLAKAYEENGDPALGNQILQSLNTQRREHWHSTTKDLDFTHSSRKGWSLLRKLGAATPLPYTRPELNPSSIAQHIKKRSESIPIDACQNKNTQESLKAISNQLDDNPFYSSPFTSAELNQAIRSLKSGKAAGLDDIFPEFITHLGRNGRKWLRNFFSDILVKGQVPPEFKMAKIIAILKPGKPADDPASYRPISLLSVCYKILERLIYNRIYRTLDSRIPPEQAGFREKRSCCEQVLALTSFIEAGFQRGLKTSVAFIDLTAAYDTVWIDGLMLKLKQALPCKRLTALLSTMLRNRYFRVYAGDKMSKSFTIKNGLPQGSVLAPLLFNLYTSDVPETVSRKFCYADDSAIAIQTKHLEEGEEILTQDLQKLEKYFKQWRLCPNPSKTEVTAFHLNHRISTQELNITFCGKRLRNNPNPKYLGVTLDRSLTYRKHLENTAGKLKTRNNIIRKLAGTTWGAHANTLRTASLALVYSVAEYCAPVWYRSAHVHRVDTQLNESLRIITGTLRSTPVPWLHVLASIPPPQLRRQQAAAHAWKTYICSDFKHLPVHSVLSNPPTMRLKSRNPIWDDGVIKQPGPFNINKIWKERWRDFSSPRQIHLDDPSQHVPGSDLPRATWCQLNRARTGHGRCKATLHKWGWIESPACDCGAQDQTMNHIIRECPQRRFTGDWEELMTASAPALSWLKSLDVHF